MVEDRAEIHEGIDLLGLRVGVFMGSLPDIASRVNGVSSRGTSTLCKAYREGIAGPNMSGRWLARSISRDFVPFVYSRTGSKAAHYAGSSLKRGGPRNR